MKKTLHIFLIGWIALPALAQQTVPETNGTLNNSTPQSNYFNIHSNEETESEKEPVMDTVTLELDVKDKEEAVPLKKSKATRSLIGSPAEQRNEAPAAPAPGIQTISGEEMLEEKDEISPGRMEDSAPTPEGTFAGYQQASYSFSLSKEQAQQQRTQRSPSMRQQLEMNQAVGYFEANAPNSFEHHYFKYVSGNYDVSLIEHLEEAEALRPNNADVHVQMAAYNMIVRDADSANSYVDKLIESGRLTANTLHYAEDLLLSVPENGVLITHGFDDTYSAWKKLEGDKLRPDVTLISLDFLQSAHYRTLLKEDGFVLPESEMIDVNYFVSFCALNQDKNLSVSMTTPREYLAPVQSKLFVTGLVFEYHDGEFNNFDRNDTLWNSALKKHLIDNAGDEKSKQLSSNYLPMLLQLRKVYGQQGDVEKLKDVDAAADKVGLQCKKYEQVQQLKKSY